MSLDPLLLNIIITLIKTLVLIGVLLTAFAYLTLIERWVIARIQSRIGPNRVGPFGLLQPLADALKMIFKEDFAPAQADKIVYTIAPGIAIATALLAWAVIPLAPPLMVGDLKIDFQIADLDIAVLYVLAIGSLGIYGIVLGGWASNNKYSLLGGLRATAQLVSYEISLGLALVGVLMISGSLSLRQIVEQQASIWNVVWQPLGFIIYFICGVAETNRIPFDLPEAETELVAGYHTEYSSLKWSFFQMAEYVNIMTVGAIGATMFFGGYQGLFGFAPGAHWLILKIAIFIFILMWMRGTLPRFRYDQLMALGWKVLLPLSLANIFVTAVVVLVVGK